MRRHAAASSCEVSIVAEPEALRIEIVDDGIGFAEPRRAGIGIRSMTETGLGDRRKRLHSARRLGWALASRSGFR